ALEGARVSLPPAGGGLLGGAADRSLLGGGPTSRSLLGGGPTSRSLLGGGPTGDGLLGGSPLLGGLTRRGRLLGTRCGGGNGLARGAHGVVVGREGTTLQSWCSRRGHHRVLERLHRSDARFLGRLDSDRFPCGWVAAHTGGAIDLDELGESGDCHRLPLRHD